MNDTAKREAKYLANGFHVDATLSAWLQTHAETRAEQTAIVSAARTLTYHELERDVNAFAGGLRALGVRRGDVVAVQLPNTPEFVIAYLAICSLGAVMQTLHMPYRQAELEYLLADGGAAVVICLTEFKDYSPTGIFADIAASASKGLRIIGVGRQFEAGQTFEELAEFASPLEGSVTDCNAPFVLLYTSGTTAQPKGVVHRYRSFLGNAQSAAREFELSSADRVLSAAPLSHLYGLFTVSITLAVGGTVILLPTFSPSNLMSVIRQQAATSVFAGPAHFEACQQAALLNADALSSVRLICLSGAPVPPELAQALDEQLRNGKVIQLWGMTELQAGTYGRPSDGAESRFQTAGRAAPGMQLRVADEEGSVLGEELEGELQVTGVSVFHEYLNKPGETDRAFTEDGWFRTGDLATIDSRGFLRLTGRVKEIINRGGVKYNPLEVEDVLHQLSAIGTCAIVPFKDSVLGEKACLFVVLSPGSKLSLEAVTAHLSGLGVAKYKWPERLEIIETMPFTPTAKVMRGELAKRLDKLGSSAYGNGGAE